MALDNRAPLASRRSAFLMLDNPVRSDQSATFLQDDVIVLGSVYGALRGRTIARSAGDARARVYCRSFEAEPLGIDGLFRAADEVELALVGRPVQAWLEGDGIRMAVLN